MFGFMPGRNTAAVETLSKILEREKTAEDVVLFADFQKAYNHCKIVKLIEIIENAYGSNHRNEIDIVKQLLVITLKSARTITRLNMAHPRDPRCSHFYSICIWTN